MRMEGWGFINEMYASADSSIFSDTGVSPLTIDYLINNYFVGLAQFAPDISDAKLAWDDKAYGPMPEKRIDENDVDLFTKNLSGDENKKHSDKLTVNKEQFKVIIGEFDRLHNRKGVKIILL